MDSTIFAYAAGAIDSDGCIQITKRKTENEGVYHVHVSLSHVTDIVPFWLRNYFGGNVLISKMKNRDGHVYKWSLYGKSAKEFLQKIQPYLVLKSERAKCAIECQNSFVYRHSFESLPEDVKAYRNGLFLKMREMNKASSRWNYATSDNKE